MDFQTLYYYNQNAASYVSDTVSVDLKGMQDKFLNRLKKGGLILDFGCGSGRDTKYFLERGFRVEAVDGSEELCRLAEHYTGIKVTKMLFQDLDAIQQYDGIWACSSILHLPKAGLKLVFEKMATALKKDGILYTSFKYGTFEGMRNGRYFTDFTIEVFEGFMQAIPNWRIDDFWITGDARPARGEEKWLNLIMHKI